MNKLSIVIPTFNRSDKLLRQLRAIFSQPEALQVFVIVLDNHSDYNCKEIILAEFPNEKYPNISIITHPYNIGGNMNISLSFYYAVGDWLWMISDDDVVKPNSIRQVMLDIEQHKDDIVLKYSLCMGIRGFEYRNQSIDSLDGLVDYFEKDRLLLGNLIFISTGVFNLNKLRPIIGTIIEYGYDSMSAINPILFGLDKKLGNVFFSKKSIIQRETPNDKFNQGWSMNYHYIIGRTFAILDYPFECDVKTILRVLSLNKDWNTYKLAISLYMLNDKIKMKLYHDRTYKFFYHGIRRIKAELIFYALYLFNFDLKKKKIIKRFG